MDGDANSTTEQVVLWLHWDQKKVHELKHRHLWIRETCNLRLGCCFIIIGACSLKKDTGVSPWLTSEWFASGTKPLCRRAEGCICGFLLLTYFLSFFFFCWTQRRAAVNASHAASRAAHRTRQTVYLISSKRKERKLNQQEKDIKRIFSCVKFAAGLHLFHPYPRAEINKH